MIANGLTPMLNVSDFQQSIAGFEKLGWKKHWDWGSPPTFGISSQPPLFASLV
jgi:hypothetical protein